MFNIIKALKKLDEIEKRPGSMCIFTTMIREILLAGHEDDIGDRLELFQKQINDMKAAIGTTKKAWREGIEERLARLERNARCCDNGLFGEEHDCQKKEPSKPTEEHNCKECGTTLVSGGAVGYYCPNDDCPCWDVFKPKKPLPSKADKVSKAVDDFLRKDEEHRKKSENIHMVFDESNPEKPVTEENTCCCYGSGTCSYCRDKKGDNQSEFISIPRELANEWVSYGYSDVDNGSKVFNAIKRVL